MIIEDKPTKEFIDYIVNIVNNPKYQNETLPAMKFVDNAKKYLHIDIVEFIENEKDPPDFDIVLSYKTRVSLEVTAFADKLVQKYNSFFRTVESILKPIISKYIHLLPNGVYEFYYFPGSENITVVKSMHIETPDFKFKIGKIDLVKQLEQNIPTWFKNYIQSKEDPLLILNKKGSRVGKIRIIKLVDYDETKFLLIPQSYTRMEEWQENKLNDELQKVVNSKEQNYKQNNEWAKSYSQNWLLISDVQNIMGTCNSEIEEFNLRVESSFFDKIYLIQDIINAYRIVSILKKPIHCTGKQTRAGFVNVH